MNGYSREAKVREILGNKFKVKFRVKLKERELEIGKKKNGDPLTHCFDLVSPNQNIIGEIKSYKFKNKNTKKSGYNTTRKPRLLADAFYLERVRAKKKLLVLTNAALYNEFNQAFGRILKKVKIDLHLVPIK